MGMRQDAIIATLIKFGITDVYFRGSAGGPSVTAR